jgi:acetoin utilization deacetylase AcuC-like enzyme
MPTTATARKAIFWERGDVRYGSLHVDPGRRLVPPLLRPRPRDRRRRRGRGHPQPPLAEGTGDAAWLEAVRTLTEYAAGADALVVSLGVDAAADDPESPLQVSADGYAAAGRLLGSLGLPSVLVQEGGYHLDTIGGLVSAYLDGHA